MSTLKGVMIILDGLGDRPAPALGGRTPLEAAHTPIMDRFVAMGMGGFVAHLMPGVPVGTQTGSGLLLGMAPGDVNRLSRGLVQAIGAGVGLRPGDVALRCNFATLNWGAGRVDIVDRRAGRISEDTQLLAEAVNGLSVAADVDFIVKASTQHRASLVMRGARLSDAITNTDPGTGEEERGLLVCLPLDDEDATAARTASLLNAFVEKTHGVLKDHPVNRQRIAEGLLPANGLITRGAGRLESLNNLLNYLEIKTAVVSGEGTLHGLGRLFDFDLYTRPEFTATPATDLHGKVAAVLEALENHDLVYMHVKGPDVCAHDLDPIGKKTLLESIDAALEPLLGMDLVLGVTADHSTDSQTGRHTGDPVPSLIYGPTMRKDTVDAFGESACLAGGLGTLSPMAFLCTMLDQMNRMHNFLSHELGYYV